MLKSELALTDTPAELDAGGRLVIETMLPGAKITPLLRLIGERADVICERVTELGCARDELPAVTAVDGFLLGLATERELRGAKHLHARPTPRASHTIGYTIGYTIGALGIGLVLLRRGRHH